MEIKDGDGLTGNPAEDYEKKRWGRLCAAFEDEVMVSHLSTASVMAMTGQPIRDRNLALGLAAQAARRSNDPNIWLNLTTMLADCGPEWYVPFRTASEETRQALFMHRSGIEPHLMKEAKATLYHNISVMEMKAGYLDLALESAYMATSLWPERATFWFQLGNVYSRMDSAYWTPQQTDYWVKSVEAYKTCMLWCGSASGSVNTDTMAGWGDPDGNTRTGLEVLSANAIRSVYQIRDHALGMKPPPERWRNYPYNDLTRKMATIYDPDRLNIKTLDMGPYGIYMEQGLGDQVEALPHVADLLERVISEAGQTRDVLIAAPSHNHTLIMESLKPLKEAGMAVHVLDPEQVCGVSLRRVWIGSLDIRQINQRLKSHGTERSNVRKHLVGSLNNYTRNNNDTLKNLAADGGSKVGLCWHGSPGHPGDWARSVRDDLVAGIVESRLRDYRHVRFYSVQKPFHPGQFIVPDMITDLGPAIADSYDLAKALMCMDVVVTVDTVVTHLCVLLNIPCFMAVPYHPDARWGLPPRDGSRTRPGHPLSLVWEMPPKRGSAGNDNSRGRSLAYAWDMALIEALSHYSHVVKDQAN